VLRMLSCTWGDEGEGKGVESAISCLGEGGFNLKTLSCTWGKGEGVENAILRSGRVLLLPKAGA
jgi:hypothetical protein